MFGSSYRIATVWGIPIKIHISLVILLALMTLRQGMIGGVGAMLDRVLLAVGLFTSIALHELGHSFVALRKGCRVQEITLMFMGGAAQMERIPGRPRDEALMALAGPAVSIALGLIGFFGGLQLIVWGMTYIGQIVHILGWINLFLAGFNLLPAFPMDGGRVMRAALTRRMGRLKATYIASRLGKVFAVLFGLYGFLATPTHWILVAIAFFIYAAAGNEYRFVQMQEAAKRGWGGFRSPFFGPPPPSSLDNDEVSVSPPPYARGPQTHASLHPDDEEGL